jgi:hypothetical protein
VRSVVQLYPGPLCKLCCPADTPVVVGRVRSRQRRRPSSPRRAPTRSRRREILPVVREIFGRVEQEVINSYLTFPSAEEFLQYFRATMVYDDGL